MDSNPNITNAKADVEFWRLASCVCNGTLSPDDQVRLDALLEADEKFRHRFGFYMLMHAELLWRDRAQGPWPDSQDTWFGDRCATARNVAPARLPASPPMVLDLSPTLEPSLFTLRSPIGALVFSHVLAAVILGMFLLVGLAWRVSLNPASDVNDINIVLQHKPVSVIGRITALADCRWRQWSVTSGQGPNISKTKDLGPKTVFLGDRFVLASGLMEITYNTGAKVILEGPCTYEIESARGGFLAIGKLTAKVEKESGATHPSAFSLQPSALFAVRTPTAVVTDLGTEFGVEVEESGATRSHVFQGKIELRPNDVRGLTDPGAPSILQVGESARVGRGRNRAIAITREPGQPERFVRHLSKHPNKSLESGVQGQRLPSDVSPLSTLPPQLSYRLIDLGTLGGHTSRAYAMNDSGQVVGQSLTALGAPHAFLYANGKMKDLGALVSGGGNSAALGINAAGQVVGIMGNGKTKHGHAFLYNDGAIKDLGTLGGMNARANAINDGGQLVGASLNSSGVCRAFLYTRGKGMKDLGSLGGPKAESQAYAINAAGLVVGCSKTSRGVVHAFLYVPDDGMKDLGSLGGNRSEAFSINDAGQVVGDAVVGKASRHAFLYGDGAGMKDLGTLGGPTSCALGINNAGQVVGRATLMTHGRPQNRAFLYSNGKINDLNYAFLAPAKGWTMHGAIAINDSGQIAGSATGPNGNLHAVLLTPFTDSKIRGLPTTDN